MSNYTNEVKRLINTYNENELIISRDLYLEGAQGIPEPAFYKALGRLTCEGQLIRISKGIYARPRKSKYGIIPVGDQAITKYFIQSNAGMERGYRLFNKLGLTTQVSKVVELYSSILYEKKRTIGNISVEHINLEIDSVSRSIIEAFEVLENIEKIEDLNSDAVRTYYMTLGEIYQDKVAQTILEEMSYKKGTIATMQSILKHLGVQNQLSKYLSPASKYKMPALRWLHEAA